jgi:hypothetical protein
MKMSEEVIKLLEGAGLLDRLDAVLSKSAIVTHPKGNRRYHHWVFEVVDGNVVSIWDTRNDIRHG